MATRWTDDEKRAYIEKIVEYGRKNQFLNFSEIYHTFTDLNSETLRRAVEKLYGMTVKEYFTLQGAMMTADQVEKWVDGEVEKLLPSYQGKQLPFDVWGIKKVNPEYDTYRLIVAVDIVEEKTGRRNQYLKEKGLLMGDKQRREWADSVLADFRKKKGKSYSYKTLEGLKDALGKDASHFLSAFASETSQYVFGDRLSLEERVAIMLGLLKDPTGKFDPETSPYIGKTATRKESKKKTLCDDGSINWYLSAEFLPSLKQTTVTLNETKKSYNYISRYPVLVGDSTLIGNELAYGFSDAIDRGATTGLFGTVVEVASKRTMKLAHAVELDYVFSKSPDSSEIKQCVKYLKNDNYEQTIRFGTSSTPARPLNHFIRRILAAASVLANADLVDAKAVELAEIAIKTAPEIEDKIFDFRDYSGYSAIPINLCQSYFEGVDSDSELRAVSGDFFMREPEWELEFSNEEKAMIHLDGVKNYIAKYTYLGALAILARGGFYNLLKAYIRVESPLQKYAKEILQTNNFSGAIAKCLDYAATGTEPAGLRESMLLLNR